jgi:hypothetical protein
MPWQPYEAKEQDAGSQEVSKRLNISFRPSHNRYKTAFSQLIYFRNLNNLLHLKILLKEPPVYLFCITSYGMSSVVFPYTFDYLIRPLLCRCYFLKYNESSRINQKWMGRDLNSRPPVCETGILTRLDYPSAFFGLGIPIINTMSLH